MRPQNRSLMNPDIPFELERITFDASRRRVERRYQSARDLLTDLGELRRQWTDTGIAAVRAQSRPTRPTIRRAATPHVRLEASELVGRGRAHLRSGSFFELPQAVSAFQAASELDPTYAAAHAGLALARCAQATVRDMPHREAFAEAKAAALRALAMDDKCADAQVALGQVLFFSEWDWIGAERSFQRALEINPNHPEAYLHYGGLMEALGRTGSRTPTETAGARARPDVRARARADRRLVLESAALRRRDCVGEQGARSRSEACLRS